MRLRTRLLTGAAATLLVVAACETDDTADPADETSEDEVTEDEDLDDPAEDADDDATEDEDLDDDADDDGVEDDAVEDDGVEDEDLDDDADDEAAVDTEAVVDGELLTVESTDLGEVLADHEGRTVYLHALDELEDGQPTCTGDCAAVWAPVAAPADDPEVGEGVDESLVGTVEREDGEVIGVDHQLTYDDRPLYTFSPDAGPGDLGGQGLADIWFALAPDGEPYGDLPDDEELEDLDVDEEDAEE